MYVDQGNVLLTGCLLTFNVGTRDAGGIFANRETTLTIEDSTLNGNLSLGHGGGIYAAGGALSLTDCALNGNQARGHGGGMYNHAECRLLRCLFMDNVAGGQGGAVSSGGSPTVFNACRVIRNRAGDVGGGVLNGSGVMIMANSLLSENSAASSPSTFGNYSGGQMALINCTLFVNPVGDRQAVIENYSGTGSVINSVVWGNGFRSIDDRGESFMVRYCDIEGGYGGEANIDVDPMFLDPDAGDFRFASGSPCIDAADNAGVPRDEFDLDGDGDTEEPIPFDIAGLPRFVDDPDTDDTGRCGDPCVMPIVDMGAYEFQMGTGGCTRNPAWLCDGDVDGDGQVNPVDVGLVQAAFCAGETCSGDALCQYDLDCDAQVNPVDAGIVQSLFGICDAPRDVCP
jgi:predicted outer membrane repeat protein